MRNISIVLIPDIISVVNMSDKKAVIKNADMSEEMQQVYALITLHEYQIIEWAISQLDLLMIGCSRLRDGGLGEVQCGEGHCRLHQERDGQEVES